MGANTDLLDLQSTEFEFQPRSLVYSGNKRLTAEEIAKGVAELKGCVAEICRAGARVIRAYVQIGKMLQEIEQKNLYFYVRCKSVWYKDIYQFALGVFGFSKSTTYALMNVTARYVKGDKIKPEYEGYSYSKLVELLPVSEKRIKRLTPDITVSEIRELRGIWDEYGYDEAVPWKEALQRGRERIAEKEEAERQRAKAENRVGILQMLTQGAAEKESAPQAEAPKSSAFDFGVPETKQCKSTAHVTAQKVSFKNDSVRKEFLSEKNCKTWHLWLDVPELDLQFYRFDFINGDYLIAQFGYTYPNFTSDPNKACRHFSLHLVTKDHAHYDCAGLAPTYVIEYLKKHAKEL